MIDPDELEQPIPPLSHLLFDEVAALRQEIVRIREQRNMADRELASDARKAHADVTEACKALSEVNDAVKELQALIEEQKAEIKRLRAECGEAERTILRLESQYGVARVERNAAQRRVCELECDEVNGLSPLKVSELNGWDCFEPSLR